MSRPSDGSFVKVFRNGPLGHLVLSNPSTLNALTLDAIIALHKGLAQHAADPQVRAIVISSDSERAFCAGGQMKSLRDSAINERFEQIDSFFEHEYALNLAINQCKKPYIALIDGIAMGGGLGISVHGSFRVVTQQAVLAMPESRIGFFPDVGASCFLQSLDYRAAYWLGLTATSINAEQSVAVGLATHRISREQLPELLGSAHSALEKIDADDHDATCAAVNDTLNELDDHLISESCVATLRQRALWFSDDDIKSIRQRLCTMIKDQDNDIAADGEDAQHLLTLLDGGSPYSLRITLELLDRTKGMSLEDCLVLERQLASEACRHPDFVEGIRSVLVDKDRSPRWLSVLDGKD